MDDRGTRRSLRGKRRSNNSDEAERSAQWALTHRTLTGATQGSGFGHDEHDASGPYLGDTLAMGQAFLALYQVTGDTRWLDRAKATLPFIEANFSPANKIGYLTSKAPTDRYSHGLIERDENIALARFSNLLYQDTGDAAAAVDRGAGDALSCHACDSRATAIGG